MTLTLKPFFEKAWSEKHRPRTLDEIYGHSEVVEELRGYIARGSMPHILLSGRAGIGKTSIAIAFVRDMLGEYWRNNFMELNASDERGIDVVRGKIIPFASSLPLFGGVKIMLLDEADNLTQDFQQALRRPMEKYPARLILTANYDDNIIEPIKSRCRHIRLKPIDDSDVVHKLIDVVEKENIRISQYELYQIADRTGGDMRSAINELQAASSRF